MSKGFFRRAQLILLLLKLNFTNPIFIYLLFGLEDCEVESTNISLELCRIIYIILLTLSYEAAYNNCIQPCGYT